jgi:hypothetical protein
MSLRIYLAAPWQHKTEAKQVAQQFRDAGFDISSRWHDKHHEGADGDKDTALLAQEASDDLFDLLNSDGMVILQLVKSEGKAFEQGFLIAASQYTGLNNKLIVVSADGTRGNVFQYLEDVYDLVPTVEAAIDTAKKWPGYVPLADLANMEAEGGIS